ncbi:MAG: hypothetical protein JW723_15855 [Bacteroidales bacterium]|nr:hypothetical protein [Bacteroidales bacterium]
MDINRNNYEVYVIDYFDGMLDPVQTAEMMYFLSLNPDLEQEFNAFENLRLSESKLKFSNKENLKKKYSDFPAVTESNFDEFCVAEIEGDLDKKSGNRLYEYLKKNPGKKRDFEQYQKTLLKPDESVVFPGLNKLKKHKTIPFISARNIYYSGVAAAVILVVMLTFIFRRNPEPDLISGSMPARKEAAKTVESIAPQSKDVTPIEEKTSIKEVSTVRTNVIKESYMKPLQENHVDADEKNTVLSAQVNKTEEINAKIKPILVRKIDNIPDRSDLALLEKKPRISSDAETQVQPEKTLAEFIKEKFMATEIYKSGENLNVWNLAQASLKGINYLTESDIQISRNLDNNGRISKLSLESEFFGFSTPLKK